MYHDLLEGIERALTTPGPCRVVVHNEGQRDLAKAAIPQLAVELGRTSDDIGVYLTDEHPVGTVFPHHDET